jgi:hypothetical protein
LIHPYSSFSDQSVSEKNSFLKYTHLLINTLVTVGSYYSNDNRFNKKMHTVEAHVLADKLKQAKG